MKKIVYLFVLLPQIVFSQKHDYVWVSGDDNQLADTIYGGLIIDFNKSPLKASYKSREYNLFTTNSSISDSSGNLLFYTNGCVVAGADDKLLPNGDNINPGGSHTLWCDEYKDGYAGGPQNSVILPFPDNPGVYYLFHKSFTIYYNPFDVITDKFMITVVDMNANNSKGEVIIKNQVIMSGALANGEVVSVKQANGKDWWVITPKRNSNTVYVFNFTKDGIVDTFQQTVGISPSPQGEGYGQIVFSPDGSKIYRTNPRNPVMVYSFDREAGVITQFDTIHYEYGNQPIIGEIGCAVSPSGRFLYLGCRRFLYQLDLWAPDISASQTVVAEWDGFGDPIPTMFYQLQLGPDCKIYGLGGGDTRYFHVIHNPDEPGLACNVEQHGLPLPTPSGASMPSFPNYRLGPLDNPGVPCTPTVSINGPAPVTRPAVRVYPNPAVDKVVVEYDSTTGIDQIFLLFNALGQLVRTFNLPKGEGVVQIPLSPIPPGVYWYQCSGVATGKIIIHR